MLNKLTQSDFKIGQKIICSKVPEFYEGSLTLNKEYTINDLDVHFPNAVCVEIDRGYCAFVSIGYFDILHILRERKISYLLG